MTNPFDSAGAKAPPKPFTATEGQIGRAHV